MQLPELKLDTPSGHLALFCGLLILGVWLSVHGHPKESDILIPAALGALLHATNSEKRA